MQLRYPVRRLLPVLLLALPLAGRAQTGVTIGALTAPDIVSSSKGALLPRVAAATAIATPATGLIVFQTNAPAGFYYNAGTPTAASWQRLLNSGSTEFIQNQTGADQTGGFRIGGNGLVGGRIGIGTSTPAQKLTVSGGIQAAGNGSFSGSAGADQGAHLQWNCSGSEGETWLINHLGGGGASAGIRFGGVTTGTGTTVTEWGRFLNNGNFGLGTTAPTQKLDVVGNASISGNALIGGNVGVNNSLPAARLDVASTLRVGPPPVQVVQPVSNGSNFLLGQSFTLPVGSIIQEIDVFTFGGSGVVELYKGPPVTGTLVSSQAVTYSANYAPTTVALGPVTVTAPGIYSFRLTGTSYVLCASSNVYAGGQAYDGQGNPGRTYADGDAGHRPQNRIGLQPLRGRGRVAPSGGVYAQITPQAGGLVVART